MSTTQIRIAGAAGAFAFADVWVVAGLQAAVGCALAAAAAYGAVVVVQQRQSFASIRLRVAELQRRVSARLAPPKPPRRPRVRVAEARSAESPYGW